jgi:hypothetical protein
MIGLSTSHCSSVKSSVATLHGSLVEDILSPIYEIASSEQPVAIEHSHDDSLLFGKLDPVSTLADGNAWQCDNTPFISDRFP